MPEHDFTPEYLAFLAERHELVTAAEADLAIPWHTESTPNDPRGRWTVLRLGESTRTKPTAVFDRKEDALLACAILPKLSAEVAAAEVGAAAAARPRRGSGPVEGSLRGRAPEVGFNAVVLYREPRRVPANLRSSPADASSPLPSFSPRTRSHAASRSILNPSQRATAARRAVRGR